MFGRQTSHAIAALSVLARAYDSDRPRLSVGDISEACKVPPPTVSKVLSMLAQVGLVAGSRGPGGGFTLSKPPSEIKLAEIYAPFARMGDHHICPFGQGECSDEDPCPLHEQMLAIRANIGELLHKTTLDVFIDSGDSCTDKPGNNTG